MTKFQHFQPYQFFYWHPSFWPQVVLVVRAWNHIGNKFYGRFTLLQSVRDMAFYSIKVYTKLTTLVWCYLGFTPMLLTDVMGANNLQLIPYVFFLSQACHILGWNLQNSYYSIQHYYLSWTSLGFVWCPSVASKVVQPVFAFTTLLARRLILPNWKHP